MYTRLTEILFKQKLKETRTICFISEVIAVVGIKHGKKRKDLWKIPQALLPITNLGASPSSPNFTFDFHFYFCFHFLPKNLRLFKKALHPSQSSPAPVQHSWPNNCCSDLVHHQLGRGQDVVQGLCGIEPGMVQHSLNGQTFLRFDLQQPGEERINP